MMTAQSAVHIIELLAAIYLRIIDVRTSMWDALKHKASHTICELANDYFVDDVV